MNPEAVNRERAIDSCRGINARADAEGELPCVEGYDFLRAVHRDDVSLTYLAIHLASQRTVAVRVVSEDGLRSEQARSRIETRIEQIRTVMHPDVPSVLDVTDCAKDCLAMVTEHAAGLGLREYVRGHDPKLSETVDLVLRVCEPVIAAHQRGVVHLDICPETVLVTPSGIPKLTNFGLSGFSAESYPAVDVRVDVQAVGLLLYELLTGRNVLDPAQQDDWRGADGELLAPSAVWSVEAGVAVDDRATQVRRKRCPIDRDLDAIVLKAIAESPEDRYSTMTGLAEDLVRWRNGFSVSANRSVGTYRLAKALGRNRVAFGFALLLAVVLVGAAFLRWPWAALYAMATVVASSLCLLYACGQGKRNEAEDTARRALSRVRETRREAQEARRFAAGAEAARRQADADVTRMKSELRAVQEERDVQIDLRQRAVRCAEDAERAYDLGEDQRDHAETRRVEAEAELRREVSRRQQAEREAGDAVRARVQAEESRAYATLQLADLQSKIGSLEDRVSNALQQYHHAEEVARKARAERVELEKQRQRERQLRQAAEEGLRKESQRRRDAERRCAEAQAFADELRAKLEEVRRRLTEETNARNVVENQIAETALEFRAMRQSLESIEAQNARLESQLAHTREASAAIRGNVAEVRQEADRYMHTAEAENEQLRDKIAALKRMSYFTLIALTQVAYERNEIRRMIDLLEQCPEEHRGEDWNYLHWLATRTVRVFVGHGAQVLGAGFSPDGRRVLSCGYDHTIRVWETASAEAVAVLPGHEKPVLAVAYSPNGGRIASGSADQTLRLWEAETGQVTRIVEHTESAVTAVAFSADGKYLAAGTWRGALKLWDAHSGQLVRTLAGHDSIVTTILFSADGSKLITAGGDNRIRIWNSRNGQEIRSLAGHTDCVYDVAFSPDENRLATASADKTVRLWNVEDGRLLRCFDGHENKVAAVSYGPDGNWIVSGSWDGTLRVWDAGSGRERFTLRGHTGSVNSVVVAPDGVSILSASSDKTLRLWDADSELDPWPIQVKMLPDGPATASHFPQSTDQAPEITLEPLVEFPVAGANGEGESETKDISLDQLTIDDRSADDGGLKRGRS